MDAGTSSAGRGARVAVTTTASSCANAGAQSAAAARPPSVLLISARLPAMRALVSFALLAFIGLANAQPDASLLQQLRQGGYVLYLRHAATDFSQDDSQMKSYEDCSTQRNLTDKGRAEARR